MPGRLPSLSLCSRLHCYDAHLQGLSLQIRFLPSPYFSFNFVLGRTFPALFITKCAWRGVGNQAVTVALETSQETQIFNISFITKSNDYSQTPACLTGLTGQAVTVVLETRRSNTMFQTIHEDVLRLKASVVARDRLCAQKKHQPTTVKLIFINCYSMFF